MRDARCGLVGPVVYLLVLLRGKKATVRAVAAKLPAVSARSTPRHRWTCGFCGEHIYSWDHRETHIADHFKEGLTMNSWTESASEQLSKPFIFDDLSEPISPGTWDSREQHYQEFMFETFDHPNAFDLDFLYPYGPCIHGTLYEKVCKDCDEDLKGIEEAIETPNEPEKTSAARKMLTFGASHGETRESSKRARQLKLPIAAIKGMQSWLDENKNNPYPSNETKRLLAQECGITERQVTTWFTNARARQLSPSGVIFSDSEEDEKEGKK